MISKTGDPGLFSLLLGTLLTALEFIWPSLKYYTIARVFRFHRILHALGGIRIAAADLLAVPAYSWGACTRLANETVQKAVTLSC